MESCQSNILESVKGVGIRGQVEELTLARRTESPSTGADGRQGYGHRCGSTGALEFSSVCFSFVSEIGSSVD